jgi:SAM-dependent methyltransferase
VSDLRERWRTGWFEPTAYDAVIKHEQLTRVVGRLAWGIDAGRFYRELERLSDEPDGSVVLDIPCGGGVAFRGLRPAREVRYVAADLSGVMLRRARSEAARRGVEHQVEFVEADVEALPFEDATFDLCVTYTGLHCFPDPPAAIAEIARVLKPGGRLRGTALTRGAGARHDVQLRFLQKASVFGPGGTLVDLERWLELAGLVAIDATGDGALAYFEASRPG